MSSLSGHFGGDGFMRETRTLASPHGPLKLEFDTDPCSFTVEGLCSMLWECGEPFCSYLGSVIKPSDKVLELGAGCGLGIQFSSAPVIFLKSILQLEFIVLD